MKWKFKDWILFVFFGFVKYVPAAKANLKNFSPLIFPALTVPLMPSVPKYFFFIYLVSFSNTKRPCLTSSTL